MTGAAIPPPDRILLRGVRARGFHGVFDEERATGQEFVVDLDLEVSDLQRAAERDDLALTLDYGAVAVAVVEVIEGPPVDLIETLAVRIAQRCLAFPSVRSVTVTVHKPGAPIPVPFEDVAVQVTRSAMTRAVLGLGANLGDAREALRGAVSGLARAGQVEVLAVSGLWRTSPVGGPQQPDYLNAVVLVATALAPAELLDVARGLEAAADRVREVRWGPRTLDVDVLDVAGFRSDEPALTVPHPRAHQRAFVLAPWAQVDPGWVLQPAGLPARTVAQWRAEVADDPAQAVSLADGGPWWR